MARTPKDDNIDDERCLTDKLASGDFRAVDKAEAVSATRVASGIAGSLVGKVIPGLEAVDVGLATLEGEMQAQKDARKISRSIGDLNRLARANGTYRRKKRELDDRWKEGMMEAGVSAAGGAAGGAAVGALIGTSLGPIGTLVGFGVGSIAGGFGASKIYNTACVKQAQDPVTIQMQICKMRAAGQEVPKEIVFAALAADLSGKAGKKADKVLKRYTGTKLYTEALQLPDGMQKLSALMNDQPTRTSIRAATKLPRDLNDPMKSTVTQYAELINSGALDPAKMFDKGAVLMAFENLASQKSTAPVAPEVPMTPAIERSRERTV